MPLKFAADNLFAGGEPSVELYGQRYGSASNCRICESTPADADTPLRSCKRDDLVGLYRALIPAPGFLIDS